ncbi:MAG: hypothetical protein CFH38_00421 [Alphaproteobacteria bacterium MarineAlpha10_Bin1]|nr:MAG: hypothetical protein CFH38_00421 [Alphaproteobacteria bacterium MarineAlpha10_Bin1]
MAGIRFARFRQTDLEMKPLEEAARHLKAGRLDEAARLCLEVTRKAPENSRAWYLLGNTRVGQKRHGDAERCYRRVLAVRPEFADAHNNLGAVLQLQEHSKRAAESFRRAIALMPDYAQAHCNLGVALRRLGRLNEAIQCQQRALEIAPDYAKAHYNLGNALKEACEAEAAIAAYRHAISHNPDHAEAHNNLGTVFEGQGHTPMALAEFSEAMAMDQDYVEAHYNFALLHRFEADDPTLDELHRLDRQPGQNPQNRNRLAFALAKAKADLGDYDGAFSLFTQANARRRQRLSYDRSTEAQETDAIIAEHTEPGTRLPSAEVSSAPIPIFVLGLSRSGKSLVESLLATQAGVFAAGESEHWQRLRRAIKRKAPAQDISAELGAAYRKEMQRLSKGARFVVSTLDTNIYSFAQIAAALPEARFILCWRAPLDNALLIYFKRYERGHSYANEFGDIAHFMAARARLQAHWQNLYGERILSVRYEALVRDTAAVAAKVAAHLGLKLDPNIPLPVFHDDEIDGWKPYDKHLQPLRAALSDGE